MLADRLRLQCIIRSAASHSWHWNSLAFYTGALGWFYRPLSSHTAAVGRWKPLDGLPARLRVHERDGLEARGSAAGVSAHVALGNAAVICQHLQGQVVVLTGAHARPHAVLKHHDLVRVVAEAQITHRHLFPLQTTVLAAPASLTVAPLLTVPRGLPWAGAVCRGTLPPDSMTLTFLSQGRIWGDGKHELMRDVTTEHDQTFHYKPILGDRLIISEEYL